MFYMKIGYWRYAVLYRNLCTNCTKGNRKEIKAVQDYFCGGSTRKADRDVCFLFVCPIFAAI